MGLPVAFVFVVVAGYLVGSVPVGALITGVDLRTVGDRNPGYWNAKTTLGRGRALPVFICDAGKGIAAALIGISVADGVSGEPWGLGYAAVAGAMIGHAWPVFAGFRGGRSVLAWVGGSVVLSPVTALIAVGVLLAVWALRRSFAVGARVGIVAFPVIQTLVDGPNRTAATGGLMCIFGLRFVQAWRASAIDEPAAHAPLDDVDLDDGDRDDGDRDDGDRDDVDRDDVDRDDVDLDEADIDR